MAENVIQLQTMAAFLSAPLLYAGATLLRNAYMRMPLGRIANVANQPEQAVTPGVHSEEPLKQQDQSKASESKRMSGPKSPKVDHENRYSVSEEPSGQKKLKRRGDDSIDVDKITKVQRSKPSLSKKSMSVDSDSAKFASLDDSKAAQPTPDPISRSRSSRGAMSVSATDTGTKPKARKTDVQESRTSAIVPESSCDVIETSRPSRSRKSSPASSSESTHPPAAVDSIVLTYHEEEPPMSTAKAVLNDDHQECPFLHRSVSGLSVARHRAMLRSAYVSLFFLVLLIFRFICITHFPSEILPHF
jgi:hypothetical protein